MPKYFHRRGGLSKGADRKLSYKVMLYSNRKAKKLLYRSRTIYPARVKFNQYIANNVVFFPKRWNWLGKPISFELVLLGNWGDRLETYTTPAGVVYDVKRATKDGFYIKAISPYDIEERFKYFNKKKMVEFKDVIKIMFGDKKYTKTITYFLNKVTIEILELDEIHLFILKNSQDAERLFNSIQQFYIYNKLSDCLFLPKPRRGLELNDFYRRIREQTGISRTELKKRSTRV